MYLEIYAPLFPSRFLELLILYDFIRYSGRGIDSKEIKFYLPRMQALQQKRLKINLWIKEDCILFLYHYFYSCEFFYYSRLTIPYLTCNVIIYLIYVKHKLWKVWKIMIVQF